MPSYHGAGAVRAPLCCRTAADRMKRPHVVEGFGFAYRGAWVTFCWNCMARREEDGGGEACIASSPSLSLWAETPKGRGLFPGLAFSMFEPVGFVVVSRDSAGFFAVDDEFFLC